MMLGRRSCMMASAAAADFGSGGGSAWAAETPIRYPEPNIKVLDPRFQHMCWATRRSSASPAAAVLPRGRCGSAMAATSCGATSRTTGS